MALSFKLYTDSACTVAYSGATTLVHKTDLSDNPQDLQMWFASTATPTKQLQAVSSPGVDQITLTPTDTLPAWAVATVYTLGQSVEPVVANGKRYEVTVAGTSHATTEPTWPVTTIGQTVVDNTVTWTYVGNSHQPTEIKLALTAAGLAAAVAGASLNIGSTLTSGVANKVEINVRITNAITTTSNNSGTPEIAVYINNVVETEV